jgi:endo-1,4-beta-xylanase
MVIDSDWGGGYCVHFDVTNVKAVATSNWSLTLGTGASTVTSASNATVTPSTGTVVLAPNANKRIISAGGTEGSTGFCANRAVSGSGVLPAIQGASGVY